MKVFAVLVVTGAAAPLCRAQVDQDGVDRTRKYGFWTGKMLNLPGGGPGLEREPDPEMNPMAVWDTCFAILFLRKSTRPLIVETKK